MKARIKETGEMVDVISWCSTGASVRLINQDGREEERPINFYKDLEIDSTDWNKVRIDAAIAAMESTLGNTDYTPIASSDDGLIELLAKKSVKIADAMIAELQKPKQ